MSDILIENTNATYGISNYFPEDHNKIIKSTSSGLDSHYVNIRHGCGATTRTDRSKLRVCGDMSYSTGSKKIPENIPNNWSNCRFVYDAAGEASGIGGKSALTIEKRRTAVKYTPTDNLSLNVNCESDKLTVYPVHKKSWVTHKNPEFTSGQFENNWVAPVDHSAARKRFHFQTTQATYGSGVVSNIVHESLAPRLIPLLDQSSIISQQQRGEILNQSPKQMAFDTNNFNASKNSTLLNDNNHNTSKQSKHKTKSQINQSPSGSEQLLSSTEAILLNSHLNSLPTSLQKRRDVKIDAAMSRLGRTTSLHQMKAEHERPQESPVCLYLPASAVMSPKDPRLIKNLMTVVRNPDTYDSWAKDENIKLASAGIAFNDLNGKTRQAGQVAADIHDNSSSNFKLSKELNDVHARLSQCVKDKNTRSSNSKSGHNGAIAIPRVVAGDEYLSKNRPLEPDIVRGGDTDWDKGIFKSQVVSRLISPGVGSSCQEFLMNGYFGGRKSPSGVEMDYRAISGLSSAFGGLATGLGARELAIETRHVQIGDKGSRLIDRAGKGSRQQTDSQNVLGDGRSNLIQASSQNRW